MQDAVLPGTGLPQISKMQMLTLRTNTTSQSEREAVDQNFRADIPCCNSIHGTAKALSGQILVSKTSRGTAVGMSDQHMVFMSDQLHS